MIVPAGIWWEIDSVVGIRIVGPVGVLVVCSADEGDVGIGLL